MNKEEKEIYIPEWPYGRSNINSHRLMHSDYSRMKGIMTRLDNYLNEQNSVNKQNIKIKGSLYDI